MLPVQRSKAQARSYYDRLSGIYDWLTASEQTLIEHGVTVLAPQPGETLLEIGCGTGTGLTAIAAGMQQQGRLFGLDLSFKMLQKAHQRTAQQSTPIQLIESSADKIPLPGGLVDGVYCAFTFELFSQGEMTAVLNEIKRLLKPDGRLVIVSLSRAPNNLMVRLYEWGHRAFPVALDCRPILAEQVLTKAGFNIMDRQKFMNWGLPVDILLASE
jgi:demethylmenaquinone methyltransferase/2-methoxy-6-polyprenyl-1,4-benzoquinol methylase